MPADARPGVGAAQPQQSRAVAVSQVLRRAAVRSARKLALAETCRRRLANWPTVMARTALLHAGWRGASPFVAVSRSGATVQAPSDASARWPLVEVLGCDAYRVGAREWEAPQRPRTVLDIGAHVGSFTCLLGAALPGARFICVEPSAQTSVWLRSNLARNGLAERVTVVEAAIGDEDGSAVLSDSEAVSGSARVVEQSSGGTTVRAVSLDSLVRELGVLPDIVKLDCEGGEYAAALGSSRAIWEHVEEVYLEHHPVVGHTFRDLHARFSECGLTMVWHTSAPDSPGLGMAHFRRREAVD